MDFDEHLSAAAESEIVDFASPLLNLPDEVLVLVVSELPPTDLKSLARCSRKAMRIADDSSTWRRAVERKCKLLPRTHHHRPLRFQARSWKHVKALIDSGAAQHRPCTGCDAFPILGEMYKCARCDESFFCTNCLSSHPHTFFVRLGVTPSTARREIKVY